MKRFGWILGAVLVAGGLAGGQFLVWNAKAQDGLPDISGDWTGTLKGKNFSFEDGVKPVARKSPFAFSASLCGASINTVTDPADGEPSGADGLLGNGHFWSLHDEAGAPVLVTGHVSKTGTTWKGTMLGGDANGTTDLKLSAAEVVE